MVFLEGWELLTPSGLRVDHTKWPPCCSRGVGGVPDLEYVPRLLYMFITFPPERHLACHTVDFRDFVASKS